MNIIISIHVNFSCTMSPQTAQQCISCDTTETVSESTRINLRASRNQKCFPGEHAPGPSYVYRTGFACLRSAPYLPTSLKNGLTNQNLLAPGLRRVKFNEAKLQKHKQSRLKGRSKLPVELDLSNHDDSMNEEEATSNDCQSETLTDSSTELTLRKS